MSSCVVRSMRGGAEVEGGAKAEEEEEEEEDVSGMMEGERAQSSARGTDEEDRGGNVMCYLSLRGCMTRRPGAVTSVKESG